MADSRPIRDPPAIRRQLAHIMRSTLFHRRQKLSALLEYLASETMAGRESDLTQQSIAAEVFKITNPTEAQNGVTVRTAATRLRTALQEYYRMQAAPTEVRISMPPRRFYIASETPEPNTAGQRPSADSEQIFASTQLGKQISQNDVSGQQGINLIEKTCLDMGFLWHATGLDAGIEGDI